MADEIEEKCLELELVLRKFRLEHFERFVIPEFPETSWPIVTRIIKRTKRELNSRWIACVITNAVRHVRLPAVETAKRIDTLRTYLLALIETKEWHAYELLQPQEGVIVTSSTMAGRISRYLRSALSAQGFRIENSWITYQDAVYVRLLIRGRTNKELCLVSRPHTSLVLLSKRPTQSVLEQVAHGLGFRDLKDIKLSGKHVKTLLKMGGSKQNTLVEQLEERQPYIKKPRIYDRGIDFSNASSAMNFADTMLGPEPNKLNKFGFSCTAPFYNSTILNSNVKFEVTMESDDIAGTLKDMVEVNALAPDSILISAFNSTKMNVISFQTEQN